MFNLTVIGNLGGDAEYHNENGSQFVTFRVGHTERHTDGNGNQTEETIWVSCILNGDGGKLLQYLKKGQKVCVIGDGSLRTYHSKKMQRLIAGSNCFVRQIELLGARPDGVPSALFTEDGVQVNIQKYYYAGGFSNGVLFDRNGIAYQVDANGWVIPTASNSEHSADETEAASQQEATPNAQDTATNQQQPTANDAPFTGQGYETVEDAEIKQQKAKKSAKK